MGNRSDRRLANLANPLAFEAVVPIRTRRADSIMARSKSQSSSQRPYNRGRIYECNRLHLSRSSGLRPGLGPYTRVRIHPAPPSSPSLFGLVGELIEIRARWRFRLMGTGRTGAFQTCPSLQNCSKFARVRDLLQLVGKQRARP